jgi:hypothetical protein
MRRHPPRRDRLIATRSNAAAAGRYDLSRLRDLCQNFLLTHGGLCPSNACEFLLVADAHRAPALREAALDAYAADPATAAAGPGLAALPRRLLCECLRTAPARKRRRDESAAAGWPLDGEPPAAGDDDGDAGGLVFGGGVAAAAGAGEAAAAAAERGAAATFASPPPRGPPARPSP